MWAHLNLVEEEGERNEIGSNDYVGSSSYFWRNHSTCRFFGWLMASTDISDFYNQRGGTVHILGSGPSLFYVDGRKLERHDNIFVNAASLMMPIEAKLGNQNMWLSVDRLCSKWSYFWESLRKKCVKLLKKDFSKYHDHLAKYQVRYFQTRKGVKIEDIYDNCLCGGSSIPAAIDAALKMGYSKILLFGVDQRFIQGKSHFWQFYPPSKRPLFTGGTNVSKTEQKKMFERNQKHFVELKKMADKMSVEIINCAQRTSALDVFPKVRINQGLEI